MFNDNENKDQWFFLIKNKVIWSWEINKINKSAILTFFYHNNKNIYFYQEHQIHEGLSVMYFHLKEKMCYIEDP